MHAVREQNIAELTSLAAFAKFTRPSMNGHLARDIMPHPTGPGPPPVKTRGTGMAGFMCLFQKDGMEDNAPGTVASSVNRSHARWWSVHRARVVWLGPAIVGLIGMVMIHYPMLFSGLAQIQTDREDSRLINYLLEHSYRWIAGHPGHREFWQVPAYYPARNVAAFSDTLLSIAPVYWFWRFVGLLPDTAFQFWMLSASIMNYFAGYWLLRKGFRCQALGSSCGAFLFAFGAPRINQLGHQQLLPQVYTVVTLLALLRIFGCRSRSLSRSIVLWLIAGLSAVAQFYAAFYLGWFLVLVLGFAGLWGLILAQYRPALVAVIRNQWPAIVVAATAACLSIYPLLAHYLQVAKEVGMRSEYAIELSLPYWTAWFYEGPQSWIWGWLYRVPPFAFMSLEQAKRMGMGFITPLVCVAGIWRKWHVPAVRLRRVLTMLSLLIAVTRFDREIWEGAGLGFWAVCVYELFRRDGAARRRQVIGVLMIVLGLTLFPVVIVVPALVLAAVACLACWLLPDRYESLVQAIPPIILTGFPCFVTYADRPLTLQAGVVVTALIAATAWRAGRNPTPRMLLIGTVLVIGSLWYFRYEIVYWRIVANLVPAARALRVVSRGLLLALIPASVGLACFFDEAWRRRNHLGIACALGLACFLEQGVTSDSFHKPTERAVISELARRVDRKCSSFYYSPHDPRLPMTQYQLDAMWAQIETGVPTTNGYSGVVPPGWLPLEDSTVNGENDIRRLGQALGQWAARHHLRRGTICWIGGRNDAILWSETRR